MPLLQSTSSRLELELSRPKDYTSVEHLNLVSPDSRLSRRSQYLVYVLHIQTDYFVRGDERNQKFIASFLHTSGVIRFSTPL